MADFFTSPPGLAVFLNAGDPPLDVLADVVTMLDESGVDCLELAVPFPNSVTDGPTIRNSANRALAAGVDLEQVLAFVDSQRGRLQRLRIALLADWSYTVRPLTIETSVARAAASGVDGVLLHGVPPRLRPEYYAAADAAALPVVSTCYVGSPPDVVAEATARASAYLYLVAHYGRSGSTAATDHAALGAAVCALRTDATAPIAVGFGVRTRSDVERVHRHGADAAIVGSAVVECVERSQACGGDVVAALCALISDLHPNQPQHEGTMT